MNWQKVWHHIKLGGLALTVTWPQSISLWRRDYHYERHDHTPEYEPNDDAFRAYRFQRMTMVSTASADSYSFEGIGPDLKEVSLAELQDLYAFDQADVLGMRYSGEVVEIRPLNISVSGPATGK